MIRRLWQYLGALFHQGLAIAGSALFLLPSVFELFWPPAQKYVDRLDQFLLGHATPHVRALGFGACLFWATFLAWKEERDEREKRSPTEAAEKIAALEHDIRELRSHQPRTLTRRQVEAVQGFLAGLAHRQEKLTFAIRLPRNDLEADSYARELANVF